MGNVFRCYVEKRPGFAVEAQHLLGELRGPLGLTGLTGVPVSYTHLDVYKRQLGVPRMRTVGPALLLRAGHHHLYRLRVGRRSPMTPPLRRSL